MDYVCFTLQQPLPEAVVTWQNGPTSSCQSDNPGRTNEAAVRKAKKLDKTFSSTCYAGLTDNVVIISHPHGKRKQVSVGKLLENQISGTSPRYTTPTCPGSSGAPLLTLDSEDNGLAIPDITAGRYLHEGGEPSDHGSVTGVGAVRWYVYVQYSVFQEQGSSFVVTLCNKVMGIMHPVMRDQSLILDLWYLPLFCSFTCRYGLFFVLGPPWTLAAFVFFLLFTIGVFPELGLRDTMVSVLYLLVYSAAMHGVTQLAYVLATPDERSWLLTALLALSCFLIHLVMVSTPVIKLRHLASSKRLHPKLQVDDRLLRWVKILSHNLSRGLHDEDRDGEGPLSQCVRQVCGFQCLYGMFFVLGPPWTLTAFVFFFSFFALSVLQENGLRDTMASVLKLFVYWSAMHVVTQLAYVVAPPDDRGWLWTALLALSCFLTHLVMVSTPVFKLRHLASSKRPRHNLASHTLMLWWWEALSKKLLIHVRNQDRGQERSLSYCVRKIDDFFYLYGLFCVVGPPWVLWSYLVVLHFRYSRQRTLRIIMYFFLLFPTMCSIWIKNLFVFVWSKRPRAMLRVEDWHGRCAEPLAHELWRFWRLYGTDQLRPSTGPGPSKEEEEKEEEDRGEEGHLSRFFRQLYVFLWLYTLFRVVGPTWKLVPVYFLVDFAIFREGGLRDAELVEQPLFLDMVVMHGVTELAYALVPPDDRGWVWTALLALACFVVYRAMHSTAVKKVFVFAWSNRSRAMLRVKDWFERWPETLASKLSSFRRLDVTDRSEEGHLSRFFRKFYVFLWLYGLLCVVGPTWTLMPVYIFVDLTIFKLVGLRDAELVEQPLFIDMVVMHGVTELADVLAPPDDRGWLRTALLALPCFVVYLAMHSTAVAVKKVFVFAWSNRSRAMLRVKDWLERWPGTQFHVFLWLYSLFCEVGPPWTLASFYACLDITIFQPGGLLDADTLFLDLTVMQGVTQLADVLAPPDDRGWLWTALLALSCFLVYLAMHSTAVNKLFDWLGSWAGTLAPKLSSFCRLCAMHPLAQCISGFCFFLVLCGVIYVVGPPWTLATFVDILAVIISYYMAFV